MKKKVFVEFRTQLKPFHFLLLFQIFWHPNEPTSRYLLRISNVSLTGPNKIVWFIESLILVGTSFLLAYLVPQV